MKDPGEAALSIPCNITFASNHHSDHLHHIAAAATTTTILLQQLLQSCLHTKIELFKNVRECGGDAVCC